MKVLAKNSDYALAVQYFASTIPYFTPPESSIVDKWRGLGGGNVDIRNSFSNVIARGTTPAVEITTDTFNQDNF